MWKLACLLLFVPICAAQAKPGTLQPGRVKFPSENKIDGHELHQENGDITNENHLDSSNSRASKAIILRTVVNTSLGRRRCRRGKVWSYYKRGCVWGLLW
eukprot:TRINITY_DN45501_c0_g1_i1.p1 TRINITY_DN45501_c0_g1~~TRINITY_DN45501_c0_g1_i1.p1  ORF type:complete len:100 (+),score=12.23 TRINITY_DN45501_c0_g1_i1:11-310(+)